MLFAAARDDHIRCTILPALEAGKWVICDRFADSTRVYQGALGEVDQRLIKALERVSLGDLYPDLTLVLDVPVALGLKRAARRRGGANPDRFEAEKIDFHREAAPGVPCARRSGAGSLRDHRCSRAEGKGRQASVEGGEFPARTGRRGDRARKRGVMSPRARTNREEAPPPRLTDALLRPRRRRGRAARRLSRRTRAARLAARRPQGHRQGDARLPLGPLRACASRSGRAGGRRRRPRSPSIPNIRWRAGWRRKRKRDLLVIERTAQRQGRFAPADCRRRRAPHGGVFRLDGRARAAGGSPSSMRSTSSTGRAPTRCSRCSRSRRSARCCCW